MWRALALALLAATALAQSFGSSSPGPAGLRGLSEPAYDVTIAVVIGRMLGSSPGTSDGPTDLKALYQVHSKAPSQSASAGVSVRLALIGRYLGENVRNHVAAAQKSLAESKDSKVRRLLTILKTDTSKLNLEDARFLRDNTDHLGPAALLAAERVYALRGESDSRQSAESELRRIGTLATIKGGVYGFALILVLGGGMVSWLMYSAYARINLRRPAEALQAETNSLKVSGNPEGLWASFALYLCVYLSLSLATGLLIDSTANAHQEALIAVVHYVIVAALAIPIALALFRRSRIVPSDIGATSSNVTLDIAWGVGGFLAAASLAAAVSVVWTAVTGSLGIGGGEFVPPVVQLFGPDEPALRLLGVLVVIGVVGPIIEELFFRGALMKAVLSEKGPVAAAWLSALAFALIHPGALQMLPAYLALGFVFARLALIRRSLLPCVVAHSLNNLFFASLFILLQI